MSDNRLICPQCKCPLSPPSGSVTTVNCPRCNSWVDVDPSCSGSCLSCHKHAQEQTEVCVEIVVKR